VKVQAHKVPMDYLGDVKCEKICELAISADVKYCCPLTLP
jgi:hypothetical protein